jgi:hypothetical protein
MLNEPKKERRKHFERPPSSVESDQLLTSYLPDHARQLEGEARFGSALLGAFDF